ncbi:MAG: alpha/beta hydrolase [Rhabdochlamydiaceae bacterium]
MYKMKKVSLQLFLCTVLLALSGAAYQFIATNIDEYYYPPPGKMVDVGGYNLHIQSTGENGPVVVLDAGLRCSSLDWALVQPEIAKFTRVCSYDRAGNGWSEESFFPRTCHHIVEELHTLLKNAHIPGPYILVGHSFGGMNSRLFASRYPDEVLALVLVDSPHEDLLYLAPPIPSKTVFEKFLCHPKVLVLESYLGIPRLLQSLWGNNISKIYPDDIRGIYRAKTSTVKFARTFSEELFRMEESIQQLKIQEKGFGTKPLTVITAGRSPLTSETGYPQEWLDEVYRIHLGLEKELVKHSEQGKQIIAEKSDHSIPVNQPDIIVEAVREIVDRFRR